MKYKKGKANGRSMLAFWPDSREGVCADFVAKLDSLPPWFMKTRLRSMDGMALADVQGLCPLLKWTGEIKNADIIIDAAQTARKQGWCVPMLPELVYVTAEGEALIAALPYRDAAPGTIENLKLELLPPDDFDCFQEDEYQDGGMNAGLGVDFFGRAVVAKEQKPVRRRAMSGINADADSEAKAAANAVDVLFGGPTQKFTAPAEQNPFFNGMGQQPSAPVVNDPFFNGMGQQPSAPVVNDPFFNGMGQQPSAPVVNDPFFGGMAQQPVAPVVNDPFFNGMGQQPSAPVVNDPFFNGMGQQPSAPVVNDPFFNGMGQQPSAPVVDDPFFNGMEQQPSAPVVEDPFFGGMAQQPAAPAVEDPFFGGMAQQPAAPVVEDPFFGGMAQQPEIPAVEVAVDPVVEVEAPAAEQPVEAEPAAREATQVQESESFPVEDFFSTWSAPEAEAPEAEAVAVPVVEPAVSVVTPVIELEIPAVEEAVTPVVEVEAPAAEQPVEAEPAAREATQVQESESFPVEDFFSTWSAPEAEAPEAVAVPVVEPAVSVVAPVIELEIPAVEEAVTPVVEVEAPAAEQPVEMEPAAREATQVQESESFPVEDFFSTWSAPEAEAPEAVAEPVAEPAVSVVAPVIEPEEPVAEVAAVPAAEQEREEALPEKEKNLFEDFYDGWDTARPEKGSQLNDLNAPQGDGSSDAQEWSAWNEKDPVRKPAAANIEPEVREDGGFDVGGFSPVEDFVEDEWDGDWVYKEPTYVPRKPVVHSEDEAPASEVKDNKGFSVPTEGSTDAFDLEEKASRSGKSGDDRDDFDTPIRKNRRPGKWNEMEKDKREENKKNFFSFFRRKDKEKPPKKECLDADDPLREFFDEEESGNVSLSNDAYLYLSRKKGGARDAIRISRKEAVVIGRSGMMAKIVLKNKDVSERHAEIIFDHGAYYLTDLDSTHGTFVNGEQLQPHQPRELSPMDEVVFSTVKYYAVFREEN